MKKPLFILVLVFVAFTINAQSWLPGTSILYAYPITTKVGIGTTNPQKALEVIGDISLPNNSGQKQIFTYSPADNNWRFGMYNSPGFTRALTSSYVQYLTYSTGTGQGFALGVNGGNSSFEIRGSDHQAYFRGSVG